MQVGKELPTYILDGHLHRVTYTRCRIDTIDSPDDEYGVARNTWRIEINVCIKKKNCASSWLFTRIIPRCTVTEKIDHSSEMNSAQNVPSLFKTVCSAVFKNGTG